MNAKTKQPSAAELAEAERRAQEERDRAAGNPTSGAEHIADRQTREEMGAEEKLQERTDDLMRRAP